MSHPLVLALFRSPTAAAAGARAAHSAGATRDQISIVSRNHDEEGAFAAGMDASPGAEIEDSRPAARLAELSAHVLAWIALVLPGIGPIVAGGPLSAGLGEAAGHVAGGVGSVLERAGVTPECAQALAHGVHEGAVLIGVHVAGANLVAVRTALEQSGAIRVETANWTE